MNNANITIKNHKKANVETNKINPADLQVHDLCRFVLSFPSYFAREYLKRFQQEKFHSLSDPFCGIGAAVIEC